MTFDPMDPSTWNTPDDESVPGAQPTVPNWMHAERDTYQKLSRRYLAICEELNAAQLTAQVDALTIEMEGLMYESITRAEERVLRIFGQVLVQAGHPELFSVIAERVMGGHPTATNGDWLAWLDLISTSGPVPE